MTKRKPPSDLITDNYRSPHAMSDAEIAAELGVSRQRVSQIAIEAMEKIRREFARRGVVASDFYDTEG
jgi:DNA-directed RNA polymerase sigma subunit (sigma70/sigma32)